MPIFDPFLDPPKTPKKPHFFEQIFGLFSCPIIKCAKSGGTQNAVGSQFIQVLSSVKWPFLGFWGVFKGYSHSIMEAPLPAGPPIPGRLPGYHLGYRGSGAHPPMSFVKSSSIHSISPPEHTRKRTTLRLVVNHRFQKSVLVFS